MIRTLLIALVLLGPARAFAEDDAIAQLFARQGVTGTLVIAALDGSTTVVHDEARAARRFSPASTFKIFNTLIALQEGAVSGADDVFKWDGHEYDFPDWNHDQTLASAFKVSCVWCYQELARRVGPEPYRRYLAAAGYGELSEPFELTRFWLDGSLQVSALEQVALMQQVLHRSLPFRPAVYDTLRDIMLVERTPDFVLRAKTGWAARAEPQIGWYVGDVETARGTWVFALNLDLRGREDLALRQSLTKAALRAKGIIP